MRKRTPDEERREFFRRIGKKGGLKAAGAGGRLTMKTMTSWERKLRAHKAGLQGGAPRRIDHAKVIELRHQGKKWRQIAEELGISMPSVARILKTSRR